MVMIAVNLLSSSRRAESALAHAQNRIKVASNL
jgi:hypothetical protein